MENLEQILQIISIIAFIAAAIKFFVTIGEYKTIINTKIETIQKDIEELKNANTNLENDVEKLKTETSVSITRMESLLIEVKTKLELLIQFAGFGENGNFKK